jgi:hypothetical protein
MKYKIVVGPTEMIVQRYDYKSESIQIGDEYIDKYNAKAKEFYYAHMHSACQEYVRLKWTVSRIQWNMLKETANSIVKDNLKLYFDGPEHIVSTVPWKQAKYCEYFFVPPKLKTLIKRTVNERAHLTK